MAFVLIFLAGLVVSFLYDFFRIPVFLRAAILLQKDALNTLRSKTMNDNEKQNLLFLISRKLLINSFKLLLFFCVIAMPFLLFILIDRIPGVNINSLGLMLSLEGAGIVLVAAVFYYFIRRLL